MYVNIVIFLITPCFNVNYSISGNTTAESFSMDKHYWAKNPVFTSMIETHTYQTRMQRTN